MKLKTSMTLLYAARKAGIPTLMWGTPGIGKTELVEQMAAIDGQRCETVILSQREPADINGLPIVSDDNTVTFAPPAFASNLVAAGGGYLFLDELSTAPPAVQAAGLRLIKDSIAGDTVLPDDTFILAAANPVDIAAGGWELEPPTANRFLHMDYTPDPDVWDTGLMSGFPEATEQVSSTIRLEEPTPEKRATVTAQVLAFRKAKPALWDACPTDPSQASRAWPSPRTWTYVRDILTYLPSGEGQEAETVRRLAVEGLVGEAAAIEFLTFVKHADLPNPADVISGKVKVDWTGRQDKLFAVMQAVTTYAVQDGGKETWEGAFDIIEQAIDAKKTDIAAVVVPTLAKHRPSNCKLPTGLGKMLGELQKAGIVAGR